MAFHVIDITTSGGEAHKDGARETGEIKAFTEYGVPYKYKQAVDLH
jgi:hypothetical protein